VTDRERNEATGENPNRSVPMAQQHTHEFDCPTCGVHLDSRDALDQHNKLNHSDTRSSAAQSASGGSSGESRGSPTGRSDQRS
jgi:hypothetical protein